MHDSANFMVLFWCETNRGCVTNPLKRFAVMTKFTLIEITKDVLNFIKYKSMFWMIIYLKTGCGTNYSFFICSETIYQQGGEHLYVMVYILMSYVTI